MSPTRPALFHAAIGCATIASCVASAAQLAVAPWFPGYGQEVSAEMRDTGYPTYLLASRYWRSGNAIDFEFEYIAGGFFGPRPDFEFAPVSAGELAPGNYSVRAKLIDIANPDAAPQLFAQDIAVSPPDAPHVYTVPREPAAFDPVQLVVKSDFLIDPASVKTSVNGNAIRVDFDYAGEAPAAGPAMGGLVPFAIARIDALAPGAYRIEGWARERRMGTAELRYAKDVHVGTLSTVVEYYADSLEHYFISAWPDEKALLDAARTPGFKRTGQRFKAWLHAADAPPNASPVCRFYATGPNSHFYTADPAECSYLKGLEAKQRSDTQSSGKKFEGWQFEAVAFYALLPQDGACAAGTQPVWRAYNNRAAQNDSNHRFTVTAQMRVAMRAQWVDEGVAFCAPV